MPTSPDAVLRAEHISKSFGDHKVLEDVSVSLQKGELVCLLGISGAGKTTLFNILSGLMKPDSGRVYVNGAETTGQPQTLHVKESVHG